MLSRFSKQLIMNICFFYCEIKYNIEDNENYKIDKKFHNSFQLLSLSLLSHHLGLVLKLSSIHTSLYSFSQIVAYSK